MCQLDLLGHIHILQVSLWLNYGVQLLNINIITSKQCLNDSKVGKYQRIELIGYPKPWSHMTGKSYMAKLFVKVSWDLVDSWEPFEECPINKKYNQSNYDQLIFNLIVCAAPTDGLAHASTNPNNIDCI